MWSVAETRDGPRLVAPFLTSVYRADPDTPGVSWQPGMNINSTYGCPWARAPRDAMPEAKARGASFRTGAA